MKKTSLLTATLLICTVLMTAWGSGFAMAEETGDTIDSAALENILAELAESMGDSASVEETPEEPQETIEETVILDEQGITIVATGIGRYDSVFMPSDHALLMEVTNHSDRPISIELIDCSVNGYMLDSNLGITVGQGETQTLATAFSEYDLRKCGISVFADIEFCISVKDDETYDTIFETEPITIRTSAYETYEYAYDETGIVAYDEDGIKIVVKDYYEDEYVGPCLDIYVSNQTDQMIIVTCADGCKADGEPAEYSYAAVVPAGKHSVSSLFMVDGPQIHEYELSFSVLDGETYDPIVEATEPIVVTAPEVSE